MSTDRRWLYATMALVGILAAAAAVFLALTAWPSTDTAWSGDSGRHYYEGQRIGLALRNLEPGRAFSHLMDRDLWPPLQTVVIALAVTIAGADIAVGSLLSLSAWVLGTAFLAGLTFRLFLVSTQHPMAGAGARFVAAAAGLLAATWFASTPLLLDLAFVSNQEAMSFMFLTLALLFWVEMMQARRMGHTRTAARTAWWLAGITTLLAMTRYAVWMEWVLAWLILELTVLSRDQRRAITREIRLRFSRRPPDQGPSFWKQPLLLAAGGLTVLWLVNLVFRPLGNQVMISGRNFHIGVARNMVYWNFVLVLMGTFGLWIRHRQWFRGLFRRLPVVWKALLVAHVLPVCIWFFIPHRLKLFVGTFLARPEDHQTPYDPLTMIQNDLFAVPWMAWIVATMLVATAALWRWTGFTGRRYSFLALLLMLPTLAVPYEERYALPGLVAMLPIAAVALMRVLAGLPSRLASRRRAEPLLAAAGPVVATVASLALVVSVVLSMPPILAGGLPRPGDGWLPVGPALREIVRAANGQIGPLLVLTDSQKLPDSQVRAMFNEVHQRSLPGIVGYIRLDGKSPAEALAGMLDYLKPRLIITYRSGSGVFPEDPARVAVMDALHRRSDYVPDREQAGAFEGDVVQVLVPVAANPGH